MTLADIIGADENATPDGERVAIHQFFNVLWFFQLMEDRGWGITRAQAKTLAGL